jgi:hypothetical protein
MFADCLKLLSSTAQAAMVVQTVRHMQAARQVAPTTAGAVLPRMKRSTRHTNIGPFFLERLDWGNDWRGVCRGPCGVAAGWSWSMV